MAKKVLIFESYPFFSGAQRITHNLSKVLFENGYETTLLLADDSFNQISHRFIPYVNNIHILNTPANLKSYGNVSQWFKPSNILKICFNSLIPFYFQCFNFLKNKDFDFIYFCDPRGATMILLPSLFCKAKKVFHLHSKSTMPSVLAHFFIKFSHLVICVSQDVANSLPQSSKKKVVYNGINCGLYQNVNSQHIVDTINKITDRNQTCLFIGHIKPQKGLHHLINALVLIKDKNMVVDLPHIFILGEAKTDIEKSYKKQLESIADFNSVASYIHWVGWHDNVLGWIDNTNYLLFPSVSKEKNVFEGYGEVLESTEGLPTVLLESSICGQFCIASDVAGVREVVTEGYNGTIYKSGGNDYIELAEKLSASIKNNAKFNGFPNGQKFTMETFSKEMLAIFN